MGLHTHKETGVTSRDRDNTVKAWVRQNVGSNAVRAAVRAHYEATKCSSWFDRSITHVLRQTGWTGELVTKDNFHLRDVTPIQRYWESHGFSPNMEEQLSSFKSIFEPVKARSLALSSQTPAHLSHSLIQEYEAFGLYSAVRMFPNADVMETGVQFGGTTAVLLGAIAENKARTPELSREQSLVSIDLPYAGTEAWHGYLVGDIDVREKYKHSGMWQLVNGDTQVELPRCLAEQQMDRPLVFFHDSRHYLLHNPELGGVYKHLSARGGVIGAHDRAWTLSFDAFCARERLPILKLANTGLAYVEGDSELEA